jgi:Spy/CpxP family protein refolding chaperone
MPLPARESEKAAFRVSPLSTENRRMSAMKVGKKLLLAVAILGLLVAQAAPGLAGQRGPDSMGLSSPSGNEAIGDGRGSAEEPTAPEDVPAGKWWRKPEIQQRLGLTPEQARKLQEIYTAHRERISKLKPEIARLRDELRKLLSATQLDTKAIQTMIDELVRARSALERERLGFFLAVRQGLTAEQFGKLRATVGQALKQRRQGLKGTKGDEGSPPQDQEAPGGGED